MATANTEAPRLIGDWIGSLDDGLRSKKAILLLLMPWPLLAVGVAIAEWVPTWTGLMLWFLLSLVFASAAGCVLSDVARGVPERSFADALLTGAFGAVNILLSLILAVLLFVTWMLGVAIVLYLTKIPLLGPVVYSIFMPLAIIGTGAAIVGLLYFIALVAPAVCEGRGAADATRKVISIVNERLFQTFVNVSALSIIFFILISALTVVIFVGASVVVPMALGIVYGGLRGLSALGSTQSWLAGGTNLSAFVLLLAVTSSALIAAYLGAINALYLELAAGPERSKVRRSGATPRVDHESDVAWEQRKDQAKAVAGKIQATVKEAMRGAQAVVGDAGARVKQGLHDAQARAQELAQRQQEEQNSEKNLVCDSCGAPVGASDVFCGSCGGRLPPQKPAEEGGS